jgi:hypothetical protein
MRPCPEGPSRRCTFRQKYGIEACTHGCVMLCQNACMMTMVIDDDDDDDGGTLGRIEL